MKAWLIGASLVIITLSVLLLRACDDDQGPSPAVIQADKFLADREEFRRQIVDSLNRAAIDRKRAEDQLTSGRASTPPVRPRPTGPKPGSSASDSSAYWHAKFDTAQSDVDNLRVANRRLDSAAVAAIDASRKDSATTVRTLARLDTANTTIVNLRKEIDRKEKCLKIFPCPSRTVAYLAGAGTATFVIVGIDKAFAKEDSPRVNIPILRLSFR